MGATDYLVESIVLPGAFRASGEGQMPGEIEKFLDDRQIRSLVAYLASLGGTPDYAAIASTDIAALRPKKSGEESRSLDLAQIERGRQLFLGEGQCVQCHSVRRSVSDRLTAPATDSLAMHGEQYLKESITNPSAVCAEPYRQHTVVTPDGAVYSGRIMRKDDSGLLLLTVDSAGRLQPMTFPLVSESAGEEPIQVSASSESPMPKPQLTEDQIDDLVAYLMSISELH
jgi:putative heme-binding domain-containing protein